MNRLKYDVVIIGAGVSGLFCAHNLPKNLKVLVLCKHEPWECNTFYAQGGITIARDSSDVAVHIKDTLEAGSHLNDPKSVELLSKNSLEILNDLQNLGFKFDLDSQNNLSFTKEGGHCIERIVHSGGDGTGRNLHTFLIENLQHTLWKGARVIDLLIEDNRCYGVELETKKGRVQILCKHTIIASGGVGGLYKFHTNAHTIGADLQGIILEHGFSLANMEMLQFHPTAFVDNKGARKLLISEAVRGEGGKIIDSKGRRFLFDYDSRGELAARDIVARAIAHYCAQNNENAFLDLRDFEPEFFAKRFPNIYRELSACKLNVPKQLVRISPAFHYCMGGILVDLSSKVSGAQNLYAIGECAYNGVHGANRLASNSLLEGLVFGKLVANLIADSEISESISESRAAGVRFFECNDEILEKEGDEKLRNLLRQIMWDKVGIIRTRDGLNAALGGIEVMLEGNIGRMLRLRLFVARNIVQSALARRESLGAHYLYN